MILEKQYPVIGISMEFQTHNLRKRVGYGKQAHFETIGVAWSREDGGFYAKLHGTQIIDSGFYAVPVNASFFEGERSE